jgi:hypothetical protein
METKFNNETGVKTWMLEKWYQKVFYIVGVGLVGFYLACILFGLFAVL